MNPLKRLWRWIFRSSQSGRFVSRDYAERHPDVTSREKVDPPC